MHLISSSEGFALYQKCLEIERAAKSAAEDRKLARKKDVREDVEREKEKEGWKDKLRPLEGKLWKETKGKEKDKDKYQEERERAAKLNQEAIPEDSMMLEEHLNDSTYARDLTIGEDQVLDSTTKKKIMRCAATRPHDIIAVFSSFVAIVCSSVREESSTKLLTAYPIHSRHYCT